MSLQRKLYAIVDQLQRKKWRNIVQVRLGPTRLKFNTISSALCLWARASDYEASWAERYRPKPEGTHYASFVQIIYPQIIYPVLTETVLGFQTMAPYFSTDAIGKISLPIRSRSWALKVEMWLPRMQWSISDSDMVCSMAAPSRRFFSNGQIRRRQQKSSTHRGDYTIASVAMNMLKLQCWISKLEKSQFGKQKVAVMLASGGFERPIGSPCSFFLWGMNLQSCHFVSFRWQESARRHHLAV